jgi:hypothetical protein
MRRQRMFVDYVPDFAWQSQEMWPCFSKCGRRACGQGKAEDMVAAGD